MQSQSLDDLWSFESSLDVNPEVGCETTHAAGENASWPFHALINIKQMSKQESEASNLANLGPYLAAWVSRKSTDISVQFNIDSFCIICKLSWIS